MPSSTDNYQNNIVDPAKPKTSETFDMSGHGLDDVDLPYAFAGIGDDDDPEDTQASGIDSLLVTMESKIGSVFTYREKAANFPVKIVGIRLVEGVFHIDLEGIQSVGARIPSRSIIPTWPLFTVSASREALRVTDRSWTCAYVGWRLITAL